MKPQKTFTGEVTGNLDGYSIEMDLDLSPEGRAHLLSLMTDLYSDPAMAVLREYSTNALDAHIEAGNTEPIEVYLPTALAPYLVIRDHGTGLSVNDLENIYSKYGASTKRGSDAVNGMLGLGGKSALTFTSQFTVSSVKNGVKAQIVVTRNEDGIGVMEVVDTRATTEPNGVEIRIPSSGHNFQEKAREFFYYWKPGTVVVNGSEPASIFTDDVVKIGDNVYVVNNNRRGYGSSRDYVVMGNVAYEMKDNAFTQIAANGDWRKCTVAFVEMGDVMFAPSREALSYTPRTIATIDRIQKEIRTNIKASIEAEFATATSYSDAFRIWTKWVDVIGPKAIPDIEYKGHKFQDYAKLTRQGFYIGRGSGRYNRHTGEYGDRIGELDGVQIHKIMSESALIIVGYPNVGKPGLSVRKKINTYIDQQGIDDTINSVYLFDTMPGKPWTNEVNAVQWSTISSIVLPKNAYASGSRGPIPILIWRKNGFVNETIALDYTEPILLISPADDQYDHYTFRRVVSAFPGAQIIQLGSNRFAKFTRENPGAKEFGAWYRGEFQTALKNSLSADEKASAAMGRGDLEFGQAMRGHTFADPKLNEIVRLSAIDNPKIEVYTSFVPRGKDYISKYPLWNARTYYTTIPKNHVVLYADAVYATEGK